MTERRPPYGKQIKRRVQLPKAPPPPEEPIRGIEPGKVVCQFCGRAFATKSQLNKHKALVHEAPPEG